MDTGVERRPTGQLGLLRKDRQQLPADALTVGTVPDEAGRGLDLGGVGVPGIGATEVVVEAAEPGCAFGESRGRRSAELASMVQQGVGQGGGEAGCGDQIPPADTRSGGQRDQLPLCPQHPIELLGDLRCGALGTGLQLVQIGLAVERQSRQAAEGEPALLPERT